MSDLPSHQHAGPALPPATPFDPATGSLPPVLDGSRVSRGEPVVLLVDAAGDPEWAADAAIALATGWARAGRRVVLADLHLQDPVVHDRLGEPNLDGVVDVFLYGASLSRTARPVPGRGFYLIPSGTYPEDPGAVLRHPRWPRIAAGFADAQATLLLFVPAEAPGLESLARWAPSSLVLGEPDEASREHLPAELRVMAVAAPFAAEGLFAAPAARADAQQGGSPETKGGPTDTEAEVIPWTDPFAEREDPLLGEYADGIPASTLPAGAVRKREADLRDPPVTAAAERRRPNAKGGARWVRPVLLLLLGALLVYAATYFANRAFPGLLGGVPGGSDAVPEPAPAAPAQAAAGTPARPAAAPAASGVPLPYSVQAKAFASLRAARQMAETESTRLSGVPLYVSPELVGGVLYYKVLAGTLADTVQASQLRRRLVEARVVEAADAVGSWSLVQFTPFAFDLGEFPEIAPAQARVDSLLRAEVPSYAVALPFSDGTERWRVYGGAFRDSASAEGMRRILADRKIEARLVQRVGSQPSQE